ncbi:heavy-metal-associated domain-containing protein [Psychroflexus sp. CAK57W]|nr:heavy metal-associated domain-containing protein [Psychroflexus curvus]MBZ9626846.1 heavy-metal-associated domain-containing protein [Psychroflexus curvus]MBZ9786620.1 heavy-metal-associated domain-containing protein [Psychroflexus curvus]
MQTKIIVQNLKCGGCANTITKHLSSFEDIRDINVEAELSSVSFSYENETTLQEVEHKLKQLGYPVVGDANSYMNKAKSFISCATGKMNQ